MCERDRQGGGRGFVRVCVHVCVCVCVRVCVFLFHYLPGCTSAYQLCERESERDSVCVCARVRVQDTYMHQESKAHAALLGRGASPTERVEGANTEVVGSKRKHPPSQQQQHGGGKEKIGRKGTGGAVGEGASSTGGEGKRVTAYTRQQWLWMRDRIVTERCVPFQEPTGRNHRLS